MTTQTQTIEISTPEGRQLNEDAYCALEGKYLAFKIGDERYGLFIMKVREIIGLLPMTRVPRTPSFIKGVINLRGRVIPVIDLRQKFGLPQVETTDMTCIIVCQIDRPDGQLTMGLVIDEVSEVLDLSKEQLEPTPTFGADIDTGFILGLGKIDDRVIMLLDVDKILTGEDLNSIDRASQEQSITK